VRVSVDRFQSSFDASNTVRASLQKERGLETEDSHQLKLRSRLAIAKAEIADPAAKKVRLPLSRSPGDWLDDLTSETDRDPTAPPKVLITTSPTAKVKYNFCEELVDIFTGANLSEGMRDEGLRRLGLRGGPWIEDARRRWS